MCYGKKFKELTERVERLQKSIETNELIRLREESKSLKEITADLRNVRINVKTASYFEKEDGTKWVKVSYEIPTLLIQIQDNGHPVVNEMFRSINKLNLVSLDDTKKLRKAFDLAQKDKEV